MSSLIKPRRHVSLTPNYIILILLVGFAIFTVQIVAEIIKRAASLAGHPIAAQGPAQDAEHGV